VAVHAASRYTPLTEDAINAITANGLTPSQWSPLVASDKGSAPANSAEGLAGDLCKLGLGGAEGSAGAGAGADADACGSSSSAAAEGRVVAAAAAARLRSALQRLCGVGSQGGRVGTGSKQPLWLYINHLGWCR
jgi:hypothetical protein